MNFVGVVEGSRFERFVVQRKLGEGSYGQVFEAFDVESKKQVALKISRGVDSDMKRNIHEAMILEMLKREGQPYIHYVVDLKGWFSTGECVVLVLELLSHDLKRSIRNNVFDNFFKLSIYAKQILKFLDGMTRANVIHGDVKPENILVRSGGCHRIKFADFGLSYHSQFGTKVETIQSLYYRAPEILLQFDYDESVDVWSAGCVLAECLLKFPIFRALNESHLMRKIVEIIGIPTAEFIQASPKRNHFFAFNKRHDRWLLKGQSKPVAPIGLANFIKMTYPGDTSSKVFSSFVDLIKGMVQVHPSKRSTPGICLGHPFFRM